MNNDQLHRLYTFLTRRFDAIDARLDENETIQNEILNALGATLTEHQSELNNHDKRITKLERRTAS